MTSEINLSWLKFHKGSGWWNSSLCYAMKKKSKRTTQKIWGMEFYDVQFSYVDLEHNEENMFLFQRCEEENDSWMTFKTRTPIFVETAESWMKGVYKIETQMSSGNGKFQHSWLSASSQAKENMKIAIDYFTANAKTSAKVLKLKMLTIIFIHKICKDFDQQLELLFHDL